MSSMKKAYRCLVKQLKALAVLTTVTLGLVVWTGGIAHLIGSNSLSRPERALLRLLSEEPNEKKTDRNGQILPEGL